MRKKRAFTLIELLVVVAIIALLISILLPSLSRARELSKRLVCGSNLKGIGTACKIYSADNNDQWPVVPFDETQYGEIEYAGQILENPHAEPDTPRWEISRTKGDEAAGDGTATTKVSTTRCFWQFVRSGAVTTKQFLCPSSDDTMDDTNETDRYYDFQGLRYISYGYQVPFGPPSSRPSENSDTRMVLAADKGPHSQHYNDCITEGGAFDDYDENTSPDQWKRLNSPNHGGIDSGEGQNCMFADGHAEFMKVPIVGVDNDNIYTQMCGTLPNQLMVGASPFCPCNGATAQCVYPGFKALQSGMTDAITDTLIYP